MECVTFSLEVNACNTKELNEFSSKREQVLISQNIVLAKAIKQVLKDGNIVTIFSVSEALKGKADKTLELVFKPFSIQSEHDFDNEFNLHLDSRFWTNIVARANTSSDCSLTTNFRVGSNYLLFIDKPYRPNSFELIKSKDDYWYQLIKHIIANPNSTVTVSPLTFLEAQWSVYTARCPDESITGRQRMHKQEVQFVGNNPHIKQVPSYVNFSAAECRKVGDQYLGLQFAADSRPLAFKIVNGEVDLSGLDLDGLTLSNRGRIKLDAFSKGLGKK